MKQVKLYEADDKMADLISDNYSLLQGLSAFGIRLGFGDKTVAEVCTEQDVDCHTFLTVVNFLINGHTPRPDDERIQVATLLTYLRASHHYFLDYLLPTIRRKLEESLRLSDQLSTLIMRLYDEYAHDIRLHMKYEEKTLFPYVEALLEGQPTTDYNADIFARHHDDKAGKFHELKSIIIKYLPQSGLANNQLTATLYDIYINEEWLANHSRVEEQLFVPAIRLLEQRIQADSVTERLAGMINQGTATEPISDREREIIVCLVQGMSNKEIAAHLFISPHTVMTHRRNIARKLQIRSLAGLTIYAITNGLVNL